MRGISFVPILAALVFTGCPMNGSPLGSAETFTASTSLKLTAQGKWQGDCQTLTFLSGQSFRETLNFDFNVASDEDRLTITQTTYADASCTDEYFSIEVWNAYSLEGTNSTDSTLTNLNIVTRNLGGSPRSSLAVNDLNTILYCGVSSWEINQTKDFYADELSVCNTLPSATVTYQVVKIDGSTLSLGTGTFTESTRPTTATTNYTKVE